VGSSIYLSPLANPDPSFQSLLGFLSSQQLEGFFSADIYGDGIQCEAFNHVCKIFEQGKKRKRGKSVSSQASSLANGYEEVET
jgi:hypothetical protein